MNQHDAHLAQLFDQTAYNASSRLAVREPGRDWSYGELVDFSNSISVNLERVCREPGQRVALMLPNSAAFVAAFFGIARLGAVVAPLSVRYRSQELTYYLQDTRAAAFIVSPQLVSFARDALAKLDRQPAILVVTSDGTCHLEVKGDPEVVRSTHAHGIPLLTQYTSGSTGRPKRIIRSHSDLFFELERLIQALGLSEHDRFLGAAPFNHVNGLVRTMLASMIVGGSLYPVGEFQQRTVLDLLTREKISYFGGVPYMFVHLAQAIGQEEIDLTHLRVAFSASAPLLPEDNRAFHRKFGLYIRQLYGSSETGLISVNLHPEVETCLDSVGQPLEGVRVEILDDEGIVAPPGTGGGIAIDSPAAINEYDANPEATESSFRHGFYMSGDLGHKDKDGYLFLEGRSRLLINRDGCKVNPLEVEEAVLSHPCVNEVVVVGVPTAHGNEIIRCVIVRAAPCSELEIIRHCQSRIADYKTPSRIEFIDALPKSDTGKILRHKL